MSLIVTRYLARAGATMRLVALIGMVLTIAGCAHGPRKGLPPGMVGVTPPESIAPMVTKLANEGERNWVLNLNEIAIAALRLGDRDLAKRALDESMLQINAVFGPTPGANQARSVFFSEDIKLFKGDPHERSMTFFYRGILYMQDKDWGNARACFRSAVLQDAYAEEEQNRCDWSIFDYLVGVCNVQLGELAYAKDSYNLSAKAYEGLVQAYPTLIHGAHLDYPSIPVPLPAPEDNLLVVTQTGRMPLKVYAGEHDEFIAIHRQATGNPQALVNLDGEQPITAPTVDSVYYQAATRGGRPFDKLQNRKVIFKQVTGKTGDAGLIAGGFILSEADNEGQAVAGAIVLAAGLIIKGISALARTRADIRQWGPLPDSIGMHIETTKPGPRNIQIDFPTGGTVSSAVNIPPPGGGIAVILAFPGPQPFLVIGPGI